MRSLVLGLLISFCLPSTSHASVWSEAGEFADYDFDPNQSRTTRGTRDASLHMELTEETATGFMLSIQYSVRFLLFSRSGHQEQDAPFGLLNGELLEQLRQAGTITTPDFTATHEGYEDVTTIDGDTYANCDRVYITNLQSEEIQDGTVRAWVHPDVPVVGAAKLDVAGKVQGTQYKIGFDYSTH